MLFLDDDETGDCGSSGPQHSTPIKSRNYQNLHIDKDDGKKANGSPRLTRHHASTLHKDQLNSTSVFIMKHESAEVNGHQSSFSNNVKARAGPDYIRYSTGHASKCPDGKELSGEKTCAGLNLCNNSVCTAMFQDQRMERSRPPFLDEELPYTKVTAHIEQDIVTKQRREMRLLMEELAIRDQELTDLVSSHQAQVQVWEKDRDKLKEMQEHLKIYETDLRSRDFQLKTAVGEMRRVCELKKADVLKLQKKEQEMEKLSQHIEENSVIIKELEAQNKTLMESIKQLIYEKEMLESKQREFVSTTEAKEKEIVNMSMQMGQVNSHFEGMQQRIQTLDEEKANLATECHSWKQKYCMTKDNSDRMAAQIEMKDENIQRVTQQLQESLHQAIALQKALFTSNEREKCKEEVVQSLRKQHTRTMQELTNVRELYERQSKDTPLYHLSIQGAKEGMKKEVIKEIAKEKEKNDKNMSYHMDKPAFLQHEVRDSTFLVKTRVGSTNKDSKLEADGSSSNRDDHNSSSDEKLVSDDNTLHGDEAGGAFDGRKAATSNLKEMRLAGTEEMIVLKLQDCGGCNTTATSTTDLSQAAGSRMKPRSKSLSRLSEGASSQNSSYISEPGKSQGGVPVSHCRTTYSERTTRSRSTSPMRTQEPVSSSTRMATTSPLRTQDRTSTSAKGTTMTSSNSFKGRCLDHHKRNSCPKARWENEHCEKTISKNTKSCKVRDLRRLRSVPNRVYESSSDISDTSQERGNCLDELTPADSDGMCHELERDFSKVSVDELHLSYKTLNNKDSPYRAPHHYRILPNSVPNPSYILKTHEWLNTCVSSKPEDEITNSSETLRTKSHRDVFHGKDLKNLESDTVRGGLKHRRDLSSSAITCSSSPRNRTQNHNCKLDQSHRAKSLETDKNRELSSRHVSGGGKSARSTNVEYDSCSSKNTFDITTDSRYQSVENSRKERETSLCTRVVRHESPLPKTDGRTVRNNALIHSKELVAQTGKSHDKTDSNETRQNMNRPSNQHPETLSSNKAKHDPDNEFDNHSSATGNVKQNNHDIKTADSQKSQNHFYNGNSSCNKSVRIQSPCSEAGVDKFIGVTELHERQRIGGDYVLKSALKPQRDRCDDEPDYLASNNNTPSSNESCSLHTARSSKYEVPQKEKGSSQNGDAWKSSPPEKENCNLNDNKNSVSIRQYYYEEKVSSDSDRNISDDDFCSHAIAVRNFPRPFTSTKAPSLYKHLSYIHFSERKNRYELVTPDDLKKSGVDEKSARLLNEESGNQPTKLPNEADMGHVEAAIKSHMLRDERLRHMNKSNNNSSFSMPDQTDHSSKNIRPYVDSFMVEDDSYAGMEKFHNHFNSIVRKLEFSSDSVLETSRVDSVDGSMAKPSLFAASSSFIENRMQSCQSQDSGCKVTPHSSQGGQKLQSISSSNNSLNDLNQGVSVAANVGVVVSEAICMTESNFDNESSNGENNVSCLVSLPDYFPDMSSVTVDSDSDNVNNINHEEEDVKEGASRERALCDVGMLLTNHVTPAAVDGAKETCEKFSLSENLRTVVDPEEAFNRTIKGVNSIDECVRSVNGDLSFDKGERSTSEISKNSLVEMEEKETCRILEMADIAHAGNIQTNQIVSNCIHFIEKEQPKKQDSEENNRKDGHFEKGNIKSMDHSQEAFISCSPLTAFYVKEVSSEMKQISVSPILMSKWSSPADLDVPGKEEAGVKPVPAEDSKADESEDKFSDRLSTFLEDSSSEDLKDQKEMSAIPMSPASKLHRLLVESQEMIRCFEKGHGPQGSNN